MYVMTADGLFFEFVLDTARGGEMRVAREFSALLNNDSDPSLSTVLRRAGVPHSGSSSDIDNDNNGSSLLPRVNFVK
jgi:hypothetical protein